MKENSRGLLQAFNYRDWGNYEISVTTAEPQAGIVTRNLPITKQES
jgi:hypothetical protein